VSQVKLQGMGLADVSHMDRFGFPRTSAKQLVRLRVLGLATWFSRSPSGTRLHSHRKVAVRASGSFNVSTTVGVVQGISHKPLFVLHRADGYSHLSKPALLSALKNRVSAPKRFH